MPKDRDGGENPAVHAVADAEGAWSLGAADPSGHWIAAVAEGVAPVFRDGDAWDGEPVVMSLPAGRRLRVYATPIELLVGGSVRLRVSSPAESDGAWPRPGESLAFERDVLFDPGGETVVQVPTEGPVRLELDAPAVRGQPAELLVEAEAEIANFYLRTSCLLEIRATDAETGWDLEMKAFATLPDFEVDQPPDEPFKLEDIDVHHTMDFMYREGLPPGRYDVHVRCEGYLPFVAQDLDLERPASHVIVDAALRLDPAMGKLDLRLVLPGPSGLGDLEPHLLLRRMEDPPASRPEWRWAWVREVDRVASRVQLGPLHPGRYEVYAWAGTTAVGRTEAWVDGGYTAKAEVALGPGLMIDLLQGKKLDPAKTCHWTTVRLVNGRGGHLPPVRFGCHQPPTRIQEGDRYYDSAWASGCVPLDAVLGPLPADEVHVVTGGDESELRRWAVTSED